MPWSQAECDSGLVEAFALMKRAGIKVDSQSTKDIGAARGAGHPTVAMLDNLDSTRGGENRRGRGNIECLPAVAAGATSVEDLPVTVEWQPF